MKERQAHGTGDINLASALAAVGIPPAPGAPIRLISSDAGEYARFHMGIVSYCGQHATPTLMDAWSNPDEFRATYPGHPFVVIMDFIKSRPKHATGLDGWLEHGASFLGIPVDEMCASFQKAKQTCANAPESPLSYVVAFIHARESFISAAKAARRKGAMTHFVTNGPSVGMVGEKLPKLTKQNLLSHL